VAERLQGALLGLWLGDLLGSALAGKTFPPVPEFPTLYTKPQALGPPRPYSREPSLALGFAACAAYAFLNSRQFHLGNLLGAYRQHAAFLLYAGKLAPLSPPEEEGPALPSLEPALARALEAFPRFHSPEAFLEQSLRGPATSPVLDGVLLRSVPAACFFYEDSLARVQAVAKEALATQTGPLGALAGIALAALVAQCILSAHAYAPAAELLEAMQRDMAQAAPLLAHMGLNPAAIGQALSLLDEDMAYAQKDSPNLYAPALNLRLHAGQLRVSFRLALWELFHAPEASAGGGPACIIEDAVHRGGSPPTQGALVAALCGARWGKGCLPAPPGLSPPSPLPPKPPQRHSCGDASFLVALGEAVVAKRP